MTKNNYFSAGLALALIAFAQSSVYGDDEERESLKLAEHHLLVNRPLEAFRIIAKYHDKIEEGSVSANAWLDLLLRASIDSSNTKQLLYLFHFAPHLFAENEKGAIMLSHALLEDNRMSDFTQIRKEWRGRESDKASWMLLDADNLLANGEPGEAIALLNSTAFAGPRDVDRLLRLAVLQGFYDKDAARQLLAAAINKAPNSPELHAFRGHLLEESGKEREALNEYLIAVEMMPEGAFFNDQLAEYYIRHGQFQEALTSWERVLNHTALDFLIVKLFFWNKVAVPLPINWGATTIPAGELAPFIEYLFSLESNQFWDREAFLRLKGSDKFLETQQAALWLRLIESLKNGDEIGASRHLADHDLVGMLSAPQLATLLKQIFSFRATGIFPIQYGEEVKDKRFLPHFADLEHISEQQPLPASLLALLKGPNAFAAAFLAAGWNEAAIALQGRKPISSEEPHWFSLEFIKALRDSPSAGPGEALRFAKSLQPFPELSLIISELLIAEGNEQAGEQILALLSAYNTEVGAQAAAALANGHIEKGRLKAAKELIQRKKILLNSVVGQEALAHIALAEGDVGQAEQIYRAIEEISAEAKSFLARQAFANRDWVRARTLTEQLIKIYPDNAQLVENLHRIQQRSEK